MMQLVGGRIQRGNGRRKLVARTRGSGKGFQTKSAIVAAQGVGQGIGESQRPARAIDHNTVAIAVLVRFGFVSVILNFAGANRRKAGHAIAAGVKEIVLVVVLIVVVVISIVVVVVIVISSQVAIHAHGFDKGLDAVPGKKRVDKGGFRTALVPTSLQHAVQGKGDIGTKHLRRSHVPILFVIEILVVVGRDAKGRVGAVFEFDIELVKLAQILQHIQGILPVHSIIDIGVGFSGRIIRVVLVGPGAATEQ
mmetsp:Transcript_29546/g.81216  ORF Transcript_29546/g.81216 Transcript_29546/m.81216 type:complete len:251 (-) Transcript_29546:251-1003(-)